METKKIHVRFSGHKTFIYSLNWSNNDNYLLSVSSDQTARVWDIKNQIVQYIEVKGVHRRDRNGGTIMAANLSAGKQLMPRSKNVNNN